MPTNSTVVALAGRRIDPEHATIARFPLTAVAAVRSALRSLLQEEGAIVLVSSAACGADLLGLAAARELGIRTRIVLPFTPEEFLETSVVDRPGAWEGEYGAAIESAKRRDDLIELGADPREAKRAYARVTQWIVDDAIRLAGALGALPLAVAVWDNRPRADTDATADFLCRAAAAGMRARSVPTLMP